MASSLAADSLLEIMSEGAKQLGIGSLKEKQIDAISGSIDLYGTGSQIFLTIISNNFRVYNTRVRSD